MNPAPSSSSTRSRCPTVRTRLPGRLGACPAFLATPPGYLSTRLHQSLSPGADFHFVNVAVWQSPQPSSPPSPRPGPRPHPFLPLPRLAVPGRTRTSDETRPAAVAARSDLSATDVAPPRHPATVVLIVTLAGFVLLVGAGVA